MATGMKRSHIEQFRSGPSIQPCSILNNSKHDIADRVLGNNRIKKYDPISGGINNNIETCYINYDRKSGIADNFMGDKKCSMSEEYWQKQKSNGLINNVYNSTEHVSSKYDSFNRCIIEINKDGINDKSLDDFWYEWGDQDKICDRIDGNNSAILEEVKKVYFAAFEMNKDILHQIDTIKINLHKNYFSNDNVCKDIKDVNCHDCIDEYHVRNEALTQELADKQNDYNTELSLVEIRIKDLNNCSNFYTKDNASLDDHINSQSGLIATVTSKEAESNILLERIDELTSELTIATTEAATSKINLHKFNKLLEYKENVLTEIKQIYSEKSNLLIEKEKELTQVESNTVEIEQNISSLLVTIDTLIVEELSLHSKLITTKADIDIWTNKHDIATESNNVLQNVFTAVTTALLTEDPEFKGTKTAFPYSSCVADIPEIETDTLDIDELRDKIEVVTNRIDELDLEECEKESQFLKMESFNLFPFYVRPLNCGGRNKNTANESCVQICVEGVKEVLKLDVDDISRGVSRYNEQIGLCECKVIGYKEHESLVRRNNEKVMGQVDANVLIVSQLLMYDATRKYISHHYNSESSEYSVVHHKNGITVLYKDIAYYINSKCGDLPDWIFIPENRGMGIVYNTCHSDTLKNSAREISIVIAFLKKHNRLSDAEAVFTYEINKIYKRLIGNSSLLQNVKNLEAVKNKAIQDGIHYINSGHTHNIYHRWVANIAHTLEYIPNLRSINRTPAPLPQPPKPWVIMHEHIHGGGARTRKLGEGKYWSMHGIADNGDTSTWWNDRVSSVTLGPGTSLWMFKHVGFRELLFHKTLPLNNFSNEILTPFVPNDLVSSFIITSANKQPDLPVRVSQPAPVKVAQPPQAQAQRPAPTIINRHKGESRVGKKCVYLRNGKEKCY